MIYFRKLQRKLQEGLLTELKNEAKWMLQYVRHYRRTVLIHLILDILAVLMGLASGIASKYLIDAVTGHQTGVIMPAAIGMLGMLLANIGMKSMASRLRATLNIRVEHELQATVYDRILDSDWEAIEHYRSGDLLHRLTGDANTVASGITGFVPGAVTTFVQFLGALLIMLYYDPIMALIALLGVPAAAIASRFLVGRMHDHSLRMKEISSDVVSFYQDSLENLTSIKAFYISGDFRQRMQRLQGVYRDEFLTYNRFSVATSAWLSLLGILVSAGCFGWGVYRLWSGAISFGTLTLFLQLSGTLSGAFSAMIGMASSAISISTSAKRLMELDQLEKEAPPKNSSNPAINDFSYLEICHGWFSYESGETVLQDLCLRADSGDLIALTGPSGEGKTTLLRLLLGLIKPQEGTASLHGGDGTEELSSATRGYFAYVPQGNSMFSGSIRSNLLLTKPEASEEELWSMLELACADQFVRELPGKLDYEIGGHGKGLSEGQAQRIAIARALLRGAPILLLDEATSALDEAMEKQVLENLMNCGLIHTCIFATHRPGILRFCSKQYVIEGKNLRQISETGACRKTEF